MLRSEPLQDCGAPSGQLQATPIACICHTHPHPRPPSPTPAALTPPKGSTIHGRSPVISGAAPAGRGWETEIASVWRQVAGRAVHKHRRPLTPPRCCCCCFSEIRSPAPVTSLSAEAGRGAPRCSVPLVVQQTAAQQRASRRAPRVCVSGASCVCYVPCGWRVLGRVPRGVRSFGGVTLQCCELPVDTGR